MPKRQVVAAVLMTVCLASVAEACMPLPNEPPPRGAYDLELRVVRAGRPQGAQCRFRAEIVVAHAAPPGERLPRQIAAVAGCYNLNDPPPCPLPDASNFTTGRRFRALLNRSDGDGRALRVVERSLRPLEARP
jgi:hypothetical protein